MKSRLERFFDFDYLWGKYYSNANRLRIKGLLILQEELDNFISEVNTYVLRLKSIPEKHLFIESLNLQLQQAKNKVFDLTFYGDNHKISNNSLGRVILSNSYILCDRTSTEEELLLAHRLNNINLKQLHRPSKHSMTAEEGQNTIKKIERASEIEKNAYVITKFKTPSLADYIDSYIMSISTILESRKEMILNDISPKKKGPKGGKYTQDMIVLLFGLLKSEGVIIENNATIIAGLISELTNTGPSYVAQNINRLENAENYRPQHKQELETLLNILLERLKGM